MCRVLECQPGDLLEWVEDDQVAPHAAHEAQPVIEVRGLTKRYGDILAVDDLSFDVEPGKVTGFLGPNGAGQVDDDADDARPGPAHRRARRW